MVHTDFTGTLYVKPQNKWFDGYIDQQLIYIEDFDSPCLGHLLKIWADKWECDGEVKGGIVQLRHIRFIITSNYHPDDLWPNDSKMCEAITRRFHFIHKVNVL